MSVQIGPKIGIEGEKEYRSQINQIIQQTKTLDAEMKKTASTWDKNTSQMTKNKAAAINTSQQIKLFNEKLEIQNRLLNESIEKYGENSAAAQSYKRAVENTTAAINHMNQELESYNGADKFSDFSTKIADIGTSIKNMGQSLQGVGAKMSAAITAPLAAIGAASVKLASDLEEATTKTEVVFGEMSDSVKEFAADALNSYGLAEGSALSMASTFGSMATAMGLSKTAAAKMSISLTQLAADMASFYNVSTDIAQTSLQGVFTGETEALKKFGVVMTQTNLEEFAKQQGKVYSKMSEAEKVMTRYAYVMQATADAQGDFSRTSEGTANSFRVLKESFKELGASIGKELLPIITPIVQALAKMVQAFSNLPGPIKKFIVAVGLIAAAIGPVLLVIGSFMTALGGIITQGPVIAAAFVAMIPAIKALAASFMELTAAAAPWLVLAAAIAAAGYLIYQNWDSISAAADSMAQSVSKAFNSLLALNDTLKNKVNSLTEAIVESFKQLPSKIVNALRQAVQKIKDVFSQMISAAKKSGADFVEGFVDGIKSKVEKIVKEVKKIATTIQDYLGFSCPDKGPLHEYETWMPDFMQGLAKGINSNKYLVQRAMDNVAKSMTLPMSETATMNMALAGSGAGGASASLGMGSTTMNIYVDHINDLNDLIRIKNQAQQRLRMGAE